MQEKRIEQHVAEFKILVICTFAIPTFKWSTCFLTLHWSGHQNFFETLTGNNIDTE